MGLQLATINVKSCLVDTGLLPGGLAFFSATGLQAAAIPNPPDQTFGGCFWAHLRITNDPGLGLGSLARTGKSSPSSTPAHTSSGRERFQAGSAGRPPDMRRRR